MVLPTPIESEPLSFPSGKKASLSAILSKGKGKPWISNHEKINGAAMKVTALRILAAKIPGLARKEARARAAFRRTTSKPR